MLYRYFPVFLLYGLLLFTRPNGEPIWVNPMWVESVRAPVPHMTDGKTQLHMTSEQDLYLMETPEEVIKKFDDDKDKKATQ